jgi:hypothetical protein
MICQEATTGRRYRLVKELAADGHLTEARTGRRYNLVKYFI